MMLDRTLSSMDTFHIRELKKEENPNGMPIRNEHPRRVSGIAALR